MYTYPDRQLEASIRWEVSVSSGNDLRTLERLTSELQREKHR